MRGGLTLIEALVVMGIIALLAVLLLPALRGAARTADRTACAGNIRQLVLGLQSYAMDHGGEIPQGDGSMNASLCCYIWDSEREYHLLGKLIENKTLPDVKVFYCPAQASPGLSYPGGWEGHEKNGRLYRRGGYYYRIFGQIKPGISPADVEEMRRWRLSTLTNRVALVADIFGDFGSTEGESWAHKDPPGVNAGYFDGHVEFVPVADEDMRRALQYNSGRAGVLVDICDLFVHDFWRALDTRDFSALRGNWEL